MCYRIDDQVIYLLIDIRLSNINVREDLIILEYGDDMSDADDDVNNNEEAKSNEHGHSPNNCSITTDYSINYEYHLYKCDVLPICPQLNRFLFIWISQQMPMETV